jgi:hypothetical protein
MRQGESYLHDGSPKVHRLDANLTLPHPLEPAGLLLLSGTRRALPSLALLAELLAEELLALAVDEGRRTATALAKDGPGGAQDVACWGHDL